MSIELDFTIIRSFYHISPQGFDVPLAEMPAVDLLDQAKAKEVLERTGELWKACGNELPVSYIGMTMFNFCVTSLFFSARDQVWPKFKLKDMTFQMEQHDDHAHVGYKLDRLELVPLPQSREERDTFFRAAWPEWIREMIKPFIESVAHAGGLKPEMIWSQFGAQLLSTIDYVSNHLQMPDLVERIQGDLTVLHELEPELFGRRRNPFVHTRRYIENPWSPPDGTFILRSSCCMFDHREDGEKCYNCPRMLPEEREERKKLVLAETQS
ncbi:(2Fe-2S)-binding protein [Paenibacillus sp. LHD-117]|uniref:(2Fe-2S)-binding protein n=1 Tax=Paenibacillus sp. LHD-117 TaxID=3071412 RepID=UPI0027DF9F3E|nr:(2Fe-2S)-binding protein [Paenibacillus sp. LHD-117]MDQ6418038.1 (2Fe-2S)-binding protein [Paenibacillus sp. LHD-117]